MPNKRVSRGDGVDRRLPPFSWSVPRFVWHPWQPPVPNQLMARETVDHLKEQVGDAAIFDELRILRSGIDGFIASNPLADKTALQFYATFSNFTRILDQLVPLHRPELPTSPALSAFTKLRDALGEIRAFVCGALALPNESVGHLPRRAFADMVASMHRRRLEHAAVLAATPAPLLPLMSAGLELNPDLATLTEVLLEDFDVAGLREMGRSVGEWWDLITQQLHKTLELQRLYSEELRVEKGVAGLTTASSPMLIRRPTTTDDAALGVSSGGPMRHGHDLSRHDSSKLGGQMMHTMEFAPYESPGPTPWPRRPSNPSSSPSSSSVTSSAFARSAPLNGEEAGGAYGQTGATAARVATAAAIPGVPRRGGRRRIRSALRHACAAAWRSSEAAHPLGEG